MCVNDIKNPVFEWNFSISIFRWRWCEREAWVLNALATNRIDRTLKSVSDLCEYLNELYKEFFFINDYLVKTCDSYGLIRLFKKKTNIIHTKIIHINSQFNLFGGKSLDFIHIQLVSRSRRPFTFHTFYIFIFVCACDIENGDCGDSLYFLHSKHKWKLFCA